jgi:membrane-anchored glycerophosphoryl diester phosphodiesterase (GDPDase)
MIGSLIEFGLIFLLFLLHIIVFTIGLVAYNVVREINDSADNIRGVIRDPLGSLTKVPKTINKELGNMSNYVKKTSKELTKVASRRKK